MVYENDYIKTKRMIESIIDFINEIPTYQLILLILALLTFLSGIFYFVFNLRHDKNKIEHQNELRRKEVLPVLSKYGGGCSIDNFYYHIKNTGKGTATKLETNNLKPESEYFFYSDARKQEVLEVGEKFTVSLRHRENKNSHNDIKNRGITIEYEITFFDITRENQYRQVVTILPTKPDTSEISYPPELIKTVK